MMNGDCQFDNTQARPEMSTGYRDGTDRFLSQLVRELHQFRQGQVTHIPGIMDCVQ
jgi:hypothetical protein